MPDKSTEDPLDRRLAYLARRQHGLVTRGQLLELGLGSSAIGERVERGRLHRVHRGVYVVGYPSLTRNGRFMAAVLARGQGAALSHFSAAVLWRILEAEGQEIHVTAQRHRRVKGVVVHEGSLDGERVRRFGIVVTTPARTLVDLADVVRQRRTLERAIDEAEYLGLDWRGAAPRHGRSGSRVLASVLALHTPGSTRTHRGLEEMFLAFLDERGFPRPEVNVHIEGYECDFVWRDQRLIVETDGGAAHSTHRARERDPVRDAELQLAGWIVMRVPYMRLLREPDAVEDQVRKALTQAPAEPAAPHRS